MTIDIPFTSKINFVESKVFEQFCRGEYVDFRKESHIRNLQNSQTPWFAKFVRSDIVKADEFYTDEVRTCTAGGVIDTKTGESIGFHFHDCLDNLLETKQILNTIFRLLPNADRALILGSKNLKFANYSIPIFEEILRGLKTKIENITIFREHMFPYSESNLHYSVKNDTWTIHSMFRYPTDLIHNHEVLNTETLAKNFREIKLSQGDTINFQV